jgi:hypothetical protein
VTARLADLLRHETPKVALLSGEIANAIGRYTDDLYVTVRAFDGSQQQWGPCRWLPFGSLPQAGDECLVLLDETERPWVLTLAPPPGDSFVRAFGPDTSTTIPVNAWTPIVLDPAGEPWRQFGEQAWEWIGPGDPDYALSPAGIRCLKEGTYDFVGSVVFNQATGTGNRGVRVIEVKGPYAGQWQLTTAVPMPKASVAPVLVAGEAYQYAGNIVELQAWSDQATSTLANPQSEWLSAARIGVGANGPRGAQG